MGLADPALMITDAAETPLTKTQSPRVAWLRILVFVGTIVCVGLLVHGVHLVRVQDVQTAIARDLGPWADETTVRHFMDTHHVLYTGFSQGLRRMYGRIYRTSIVGLMKGRILVQFDFDEQGRMNSYRVVEVYDFIWE